TPAARRIASGRFKTPARRISSPVTTSTPLAADHQRSGLRETVVTFRLTRSSSDSEVRSLVSGSGGGGSSARAGTLASSDVIKKTAVDQRPREPILTKKYPCCGDVIA